MKISASLYANSKKTLKEQVQELDECHIDMFHIDCDDDLSVFHDIEEIKRYSSTPIDLHIISSNPEMFFEEIKKHEVEYVSVQYERLASKIELPTIKGTQFGLAIESNTSIEVFKDYADQCDFVLIMTTTPGVSGGKFKKENFKKIRKFHNIFPGVRIHVDGGVDDETGFILRMLGVQSVVSGSYLANHKSVGIALLHLRSSITHSDYAVRDFMIDLEDVPVLNAGADVKEIFTTIEDYKLGFALISREDGTLYGLCSNADMRRGFLKHLDDFNQISPKDIINTNPVSTYEDATISQLLEEVQSHNFLISFLPVLNHGGKLVGALSFINLIMSES